MSNPEKDQDRVFDTTDHFKRFGVVMFSENRKAYEYVAKQLKGKDVFEAGCGMGLGSALLEREAKFFIATDKLEQNVKFAKELYSWINFKTWDINDRWLLRPHQVVVCIEAIEHVGNPEKGIKNLMNLAIEEVWISTPSPDIGEENPSNPFHVKEWTEAEFVELLKPYGKIEIPFRGLYHVIK